MQKNYASELKYTIDTELSPGNLKFLLEYLRRQHLLQHKKYRAFRDIRIIAEKGLSYLSYTVLIPETNQHVNVTVNTSVPIGVIMKLRDPNTPKSFLDQLYADLFLTVQLFEEEIRKTTLCLAFVPGEKIVPESESSGIIGRIFTEPMLPLYIALTTLTFLFFWIFAKYAPLIVVSLGFVLSIFSGKLVAKSGNWKITEDRPEILLLQYYFSPEKFKGFRKKYAQNIFEIRKRIYDASIAVGRPIDCETASGIFSTYGIDCKPESLSVKKVNIFQIVKKAADKFGLSVPEIVVVNSIIPNAAAAGPSPGLGTIMVTTGIMTQLKEDELLNVIGHEMSHLKAREPK